MKKINLGIVGAGHRSILYAKHAVELGDHVSIKAIAEPNGYRRSTIGDRFHIPKENRFQNAKELAQSGLTLDGVINGTMDHIHHQTSMELLEAGYPMLLEKPICTNKEDLLEIYEKATQKKTMVMVCHVLRYAPFYSTIKSILAKGSIGDVVSVYTDEHVAYHHMAVGYIRGKWNQSKVCGSTILMAKCCHDLDILTWMKGKRPVRVASFGSLYQFKPEHAPKGAGTRCGVDCGIEGSFPVSGGKNYIHRNMWDMYVWESIESSSNKDSNEVKLGSLNQDNPYGRCVYGCDNDMYDNQSVIIEFEDGTTSNHNLIASTSSLARNIFIKGTKGDIQGTLEKNQILLRHYAPEQEKWYTEEVINIEEQTDGHGGGDQRLVDDFIKILSGKRPSLSVTQLSDSIYGHLIGFQAQQALESKNTVERERI